MNYPVVSILIAGALAFMLVTVCAGYLPRLGFPLPAAGRRIGCIDGLRGYLALAVAAHHFIYWLQASRLGGAWRVPPFPFFNQLGKGGVALFFMTTGLVFYPQILRGFRAAAWPVLLINRIFRIVPLVMVSVILISGIIAIRTGHSIDSGYPLAVLQWITSWGQPPLLGYRLSWLINAGVLWSLRFEWLFYLLLLPAAAFAMDRIRGRYPTWSVPAVILVVALVAQEIFGAEYGLRYLPLFAIGMLAYEVQAREWLAATLRTPLVTAASVLLLVSTMVLFKELSMTVLPGYALFFTCVACGNSFGGALRTAGALVLGECSYGIYLIHGILLSLLYHDGARWLAPLSISALPFTMLPLFVCVLLVTATLFLGVERPAITAGRRIGKMLARTNLRLPAQEEALAP